jgi:cephalosporin hydroxylase
MEEINKKFNTEFTNKLLENKHIFYEIYSACGSKFHKGCGSYLFDGQTYEYCDLMYEKQELLFNTVKNMNTVLEIGTYMGHSLLIMLLSNPTLKITCIDIDSTYTYPAVNILNKYFNNSITFINGDSITTLKKINNKFDFFHIDGMHDNNYISEEFKLIKQLSSSCDSLKVIFDDEECLPILQNNIKNNYTIINCVKPTCRWANLYYEIKI